MTGRNQKVSQICKGLVCLEEKGKEVNQDLEKLKFRESFVILDKPFVPNWLVCFCFLKYNLQYEFFSLKIEKYYNKQIEMPFLMKLGSYDSPDKRVTRALCKLW